MLSQILKSLQWFPVISNLMSQIMESSKLEMKDFQVPELFTSYVHTLHFIYTSVSFPHPSSFAEVDYFKCSRTWQGTARNKGEKKKKMNSLHFLLLSFLLKCIVLFFPVSLCGYFLFPMCLCQTNKPKPSNWDMRYLIKFGLFYFLFGRNSLQHANCIQLLKW